MARMRRKLIRCGPCREDHLDNERPGDPDPPSSPPSLKKETRGCRAKTREDGGCRKVRRLKVLLRKCQKLIALDRGLRPQNPPPARITCGCLRPALRSTYPLSLTWAEELSLKTAQKIEGSPCKPCRQEKEGKLSEWMQARMKPQEVSPGHLLLFKRAVAQNVPCAWNVGARAYVPNGSSTLYHSRGEGGNWNKEIFSELCSVMQVYTAGKPRVVTLYSSRNTEVLYPLHKNLYARLGQGEWLLKGPPTNEQVGQLTGQGEFVSVDYQSATDNIKLAYVNAMIDVLIDKGEGLSEEDCRALRVVGALQFFERIDDGIRTVETIDCNGQRGDGEVLLSHEVLRRATCGQPMGSMMSFPLLCLANKASFDLGLEDLLISGEISQQEYASHRCLINGDDLLFKEVKNESSRTLTLYDRLHHHASMVGLKLNLEKTARDATRAEINSTAFHDGIEQKKTNLACLKPERETRDLLGFAIRSTVSTKGLMNVLLGYARRFPCGTDVSFERSDRISTRSICSNARLHAWLCKQPSPRQPARNGFPVTRRPEGYDLVRDEEQLAIKERVSVLRSRGFNLVGDKTLPSSEISGTRSLESLFAPRPVPDDNILMCHRRFWEEKMKRKLVESDPVLLEPQGRFWDESTVGYLVGLMRTFKAARAVGKSPPLQGFDGDFVYLDS